MMHIRQNLHMKAQEAKMCGPTRAYRLKVRYAIPCGMHHSCIVTVRAHNSTSHTSHPPYITNKCGLIQPTTSPVHGNPVAQLFK